MKAMKYLALALIMSVATTFAQSVTGFNIEFDDPDVVIQPVPVGQAPYWMLSSPGALRAYALSLVARGESNVFGDTIVFGQSSKLWTNVEGKTPHEVISSLGSEDGTLVFDLADPSHDQVHRGGTLMDKDWNTLFYGWEFYVSPVRVGSSWRLPSSAIQLQKNSWTPIPVPEGVTGGKIFYRDSDGNYVWTQWDLNVWNGKMWFPDEYAGKGQLVLESKNGSILVDLRTGREIVPTRIATSVQSELSNYSYLADKAMASGEKLQFAVEADASDNPSDAPIVWVTLSEARTVKFTMKVVDENGSTAEQPMQAYAYNRTTGAIRPMTASVTVNLNGGVSEPYFESYLDQKGEWVLWWNTEHFNRDPYPPYYGEGKG